MMINNVLQFITDITGGSIDTNLGSVRRLSNLITTVQLVSPLDATHSVYAEFLLANGDTATQYMRIAIDSDGIAYKGIDVMDSPTEAQKEWNVWEIELSQTTLSKISKFRAGKVGVSFIFRELVSAVEGINDLGTFGSVSSTTGGDLPTGPNDHNSNALTIGDFYECDLLSYTSTETGTLYTIGQAAYWDGTEWQDGTAFTLIQNTSIKYFGVDAALSGQVPSIEASTTDQVLSDLAINTANISTNASDIDALETLTADYSTLEALASTNETNVASNDVDIAAMKGSGWTDENIKENSDNISTNTTNIGSTQTSISNLAGAGRTTETVKANKGLIDSNIVDIGTNLTDIATNAAAIIVSEGDITAIEAELLVKADLVGGLVPASQLPGYVDDVLEYADVAAFPVSGESGKIYIDISTNDTYRWASTVYVKINDVLSNSDIKTMYEANADTNAFTDAFETKLTDIEAYATADQSQAEIKAAYEANSDTNVFTDSEKSKLLGIEADATADQTASEIETLYEGITDTNKYTDAEETKVGFISVTQAVDLDAMETATTTNATNIGTNDTEISTNTTNIGTNTTNIGTNTTNIGTNTTDIGTNATNLSDHESETTGAHASTSISYDNTVSGMAATEVKSAIDELKVDYLTTFNTANDLLQLDGDALVPSANLPSYVDDVLEVATYSALPATGETGKIYVVIADENDSGNTSTYRWSGSVYIMISDLLDNAEVKSMYEANSDTNAFTDAYKAELDDGVVNSVNGYTGHAVLDNSDIVSAEIEVTGSRDITTSDSGQLLRVTTSNDTLLTLTTSTALTNEIVIMKYSTGNVEVDADTLVTLYSNETPILTDQYSSMLVRRIANNTYVATVGASEAAASTTLDELADVQFTSLTTGNILKYDGNNWVNATDETGTTIDSIDDISDVTITNPSDNQFLRHNGTNWVNETVSLTTTLDALTDTILTAPEQGSVLTYSSGNWIDTTLLLDSAHDVVLTSESDNQFLRYDSSTSKWINETVSIPTALTDTDDLNEGSTNLYASDANVAATPAVSANTAKISFDSTSSTKLGTIEEGAEVNDADTVLAPSGVLPVLDGSNLTDIVSSSTSLLPTSGTWNSVAYTDAVNPEGRHATENVGDQSVSFGYNSYATTDNSMAYGANARATGANSVALGYLTQATSDSTVVVGNLSSAKADFSTALGGHANNFAASATAIGYNADIDASATYSIQLGRPGDGSNLTTADTFRVWTHNMLDRTTGLIPAARIPSLSYLTSSSTLDATKLDGLVPAASLPGLALTDVNVVSTEVAQLALTVQEGDIAVRTDLSKTYIALNDTNAAMTDWTEMLTPTGISSLTDLTDVTISSPGTGASLTYNGSGWVDSILTINDLSDVSITSPSTGQFLRNNGGFNWYNDTISTDDVAEGSNLYYTDDRVLDVAVNKDLVNGSFIESFDAIITTGGTNPVLSLEQSGTGDLTMQFSTGDVVLDCTPALEVNLSYGTSTVPLSNYTYVPISTKVLTNSTVGWPTEEHIRVAYSLLLDITYTDGPLVNQNWNDHLKGTNGQGHLLHLSAWARRQGATYFSGIDGNGTDEYITVNNSLSTIYFKSTAGVIAQLHPHTFLAKDTDPAGGNDDMHIVNHFTTPYLEIHNMADITADANGDAMGEYYNLIVWGVANKGGTYDPLMINLPVGSYSTEANALADTNGYDVYTVPREFGLDSSTGFLIARITLREKNGTHTYIGTKDLRGIKANASGGSGSAASGGTQVYDLPDNLHRIYNLTDGTKEIAFDASGISTATTRTITMPDVDVDLGDISNIPTNTDNLTEGSTNLYYTSARFTTDFSLKDTDDLTEGSTNLYADANATNQGNTFNGNSQLVQTTADGKLPILDGSNLTNLPSGSDTLSGLTDTTITTPSTDQVLSYNGSAWVNAAAPASGSSVTISDSAPSSPSAGDQWWDSVNGKMKIYYDSFWVDASPSSAIPLEDLTDTNITSIADNHILTYDSATSKWINEAPATPTVELDDLSDVDLTTTAPTTGDILEYDGTDWVPSAPAGGGATPEWVYLTSQTSQTINSTSLGEALDFDNYDYKLVLTTGDNASTATGGWIAIGSTGSHSGFERVSYMTADTAETSALQGDETGTVVGFGYSATTGNESGVHETMTEIIVHKSEVASTEMYMIKGWSTIAWATVDAVYMSEFTGRALKTSPTQILMDFGRATTGNLKIYKRAV